MSESLGIRNEAVFMLADEFEELIDAVQGLSIRIPSKVFQ